MKSLNKLQLIVVIFSLLSALFFVIFFANKTPQKKEDHTAKPELPTKGLDLEKFTDQKIALLPDSLKKTFNALNVSINENKTKIAPYDSMMRFWDRLFQPFVSAVYMEKKASAFPSDSSWFESGNRFLSSIQFVNQAEHAKALLLHAIQSFEKGLKLNPNNVDARIRLASCYLEDEKDPMKGISMLREIEKTDSNNMNLQLTFGFASFRSGQWDRAIRRFNKVLELNPEYLEAYLYLADVYEKKGDKAMTIKTLEEYYRRVPDKEAKNEILKYIDKLKNS